MSLEHAVRETARKYYEETGRPLLAITVSDEEFEWLQAELGMAGWFGSITLFDYHEIRVQRPL